MKIRAKCSPSIMGSANDASYTPREINAVDSGAGSSEGWTLCRGVINIDRLAVELSTLRILVIGFTILVTKCSREGA